MKNWFGLEPHTTDGLIHWSLKDKERILLAAKVRAAYDKIKEAGLVEELKYLLEAAREAGVQDEADNNAGESL